jgi:hypothetical protein
MQDHEIRAIHLRTSPQINVEDLRTVMANAEWLRKRKQELQEIIAEAHETYRAIESLAQYGHPNIKIAQEVGYKIWDLSYFSYEVRGLTVDRIANFYRNAHNETTWGVHVNRHGYGPGRDRWLGASFATPELAKIEAVRWVVEGKAYTDTGELLTEEMIPMTYGKF